jgi:hypothetical protein
MKFAIPQECLLCGETIVRRMEDGHVENTARRRDQSDFA